jgi:hypothetical protein
MERTEASIQQQCIQHFRNTYCLAHHDPRFLMFSVPNEGKNVLEQMKKKATGMLPGVSDTIIDFGFDIVYCEFKDAKGKQREDQIKFQQRVELMGRKYWLIRSLDEFVENVEKLLEERK